MKNKPILLHISYIWGAVADGAMAIMMLFPEHYLRLTNSNMQSSQDFAYGLVNGAPLMIGWTVLLLWANRKPQERKHILAITLLVIFGYIAVEIHALQVGISSIQSTLPLFFMQGALTIMIIASLLHNRFEE
ncbi:MAG: hypothetical protein JEZ00_16370 [Anaerolineaceae bacterium]|nr:hypothetical protein [Anaerolineaceae bacterium]